MRFFVVATLLVAATAMAAEPGTWIDLTHPLDRLPDTGAFVAALPMKIAGGSGGPLRIVARLPESDR